MNTVAPVELRSLSPRPDLPELRSSRMIYCVPAAGSGARGFLQSFSQLPLRAALRVAQLPGREDRLDEPFVEDVPRIAEHLANLIADDGSNDYALFGHSFGAMVMFQTARVLEDLGAPPPAVLAVAACVPPHLPSAIEFEKLDDEQIIRALTDLGGVDLSGPGGAELASLVIPPLRADCTAYARYLEIAGSRPVNCPLLALSGAQDLPVTLDKVAQWRRYTLGSFGAREMDGDHFFPLRSDRALQEVLDIDMRKDLADA